MQRTSTPFHCGSLTLPFVPFSDFKAPCRNKSVTGSGLRIRKECNSTWRILVTLLHIRLHEMNPTKTKTDMRMETWDVDLQDGVAEVVTSETRIVCGYNRSVKSNVWDRLKHGGDAAWRQKTVYIETQKKSQESVFVHSKPVFISYTPQKQWPLRTTGPNLEISTRKTLHLESYITQPDNQN
jgi:hypothetical protein